MQAAHSAFARRSCQVCDISAGSISLPTQTKRPKPLPPVHPMKPRPALATSVIRLRELVDTVAAARTKHEARPGVAELRAETRQLRRLLPPMAASVLARVTREAEAASGTVFDKGLRLAELQESWELLVRLLAGL